MAVTIPKEEYLERVTKLQNLVKEAGLDAVLVHGIESDCANVRYLSEYWPTFECAGVVVPAEGVPVLCVGPESEWYAKGRTMLANVCQMHEYRESADPEYPGFKVATFPEVFALALEGKPLRKLGLISYAITPLPVYDSLKANYPDLEIVKADNLIRQLRSVKSENEIACMRKAYQISEIAVDAILNEIKVGMTEFQVCGIAQRELYKNGAEYEGHALYVFCGKATRNAISRPTSNLIVPNEVIQLNIGARVCGYSSSIGVPFSIGPLPERKRKLVEFGLKAHFKTYELLKGGKVSGDVVKEYEEWVKSQGYGDYMLYGPCHSIGLMEVEYPWMESTSTYTLRKNYMYQCDTFFYDKDFGCRWEDGARITDDGVEWMSSKHAKYTELPIK